MAQISREMHCDRFGSASVPHVNIFCRRQKQNVTTSADRTAQERIRHLAQTFHAHGHETDSQGDLFQNNTAKVTLIKLCNLMRIALNPPVEHEAWRGRRRLFAPCLTLLSH